MYSELCVYKHFIQDNIRQLLVRQIQFLYVKLLKMAVLLIAVLLSFSNSVISKCPPESGKSLNQYDILKY